MVQVHLCLIFKVISSFLKKKKFTEYSLIGKISVLGIEAGSSNLPTLIKKLRFKYKKKKNFFQKLWFNNFLPSSISFLITALLFFIKNISYFIRIFSLAIRLFANILAGHILLHLLITYLSLIIKSLNFFLIFSLNLLEIFMQACIFILLFSM